jgi:predicted nucleic acid-binding protein
LTAVVVDSSVALKWFIPEGLSENAVRLLDGTHTFIAPDLLYPEIGNILWKKIGRDEIEASDAKDILAGFRRMPITVVPSEVLLEAALEIALDHKRSVYDALYVALAVARDSVLITADDRLANALSTGPLASYVRALASYA